MAVEPELENIDDSRFETFYLSQSSTDYSSLDYEALYELILTKYPKFNTDQYSIVIVKKTFVTILEDAEFMTYILKVFDITLKDFFKIVYKHNSIIFNTYFVNKIKDTIEHVTYS